MWSRRFRLGICKVCLVLVRGYGLGGGFGHNGARRAPKRELRLLALVEAHRRPSKGLPGTYQGPSVSRFFSRFFRFFGLSWEIIAWKNITNRVINLLAKLTRVLVNY